MSHSLTFSDCYDQYKHKVYSFFYYRLNGDEQLAEDLTSDTFLKVFDKFDSYNEKYALSTWVYTIAKNTLTDFFRKNKADVSLEDYEEIHGESEDERLEDIEKKLNTALTTEKVLEVLEELPPFHKECIVLRYLEEMEMEEIAEITGKSEANVRQALSRGMKKLKSYEWEFIVILLFFS